MRLRTELDDGGKAAGFGRSWRLILWILPFSFIQVTILGGANYLLQLQADVQSHLTEGNYLLDLTEADLFRSSSEALVGLVIALLLTLTLQALTTGLVFSRVALRPLAVLGQRLDVIATGGADLTQRLTVTRRDEVGRLAEAFNRFTGGLGLTVRRL